MQGQKDFSKTVKAVLTSTIALFLYACVAGAVNDIDNADGPDSAFSVLTAQFVDAYETLNIPPHELSFVANLKALGDPGSLEKQRDELSRWLVSLSEVDGEALDRCQRIDYAKMTMAARLGVRRATLGLRYLDETAPDEMPDTLIKAPLGAEWYQYYLEQWNSADVDVDDLFGFGEKALAKTVAAYDALQTEMGFEGDDAAFAAHLAKPQFHIDGGEQTVLLFEAKQKIVWDNLSELFAETYGVTPAKIKKSDRGASFAVPGYYNNDEGAFYYNVLSEKYEARQADWLLLHEGTPGHHFQINTAAGERRCDSPLSNLFFPAYVEGWAAYVETMGSELGLYQTPEEKLSAIEWDMVRSARVALDIGINAYGWDDEKALVYWKENVRGQEDIAMREIARMRRWPGQVITYKYGADVFERSKAVYLSVRSGEADVRDYHDIALGYGAMPLDAFEALVASDLE